MRKGYSKEVRVEAISRRLEGNTWEEIQELILKKYRVEPSIRQIQKWFYDYKQGEKDPTGDRPMAKVMEDMIQARILAEAASGPTGPPAIELAAYAATPSGSEGGLNVKTATTLSLLLLETQVGRESFDIALEYYLKRRDELHEFSDWFSGPTGPSGLTGPHGPMEPDH